MFMSDEDTATFTPFGSDLFADPFVSEEEAEEEGEPSEDDLGAVEEEEEAL